MSSHKQILSAVEIRWPVATWVLGAHVYAVLVPLALCGAVHSHWDYLLRATYNPFLFYIAAAFFCAASAFEVAQNAFDKWYLTENVGSTTDAGFCDFLFFLMATAGQSACVLALGGGEWWAYLITTTAMIMVPVLYFTQVMHFAPLSAVNLLAIYLGYTAFGDPVIFLQLLLVAVTLYFFSLLLRTGAQVIHGFTTIAASSGTWFFIWALHNGASETQNSWAFALAIVTAALIAGTMLWPMLVRLPASLRVVRQ